MTGTRSRSRPATGDGSAEIAARRSPGRRTGAPKTSLCRFLAPSTAIVALLGCLLAWLIIANHQTRSSSKLLPLWSHVGPRDVDSRLADASPTIDRGRAGPGATVLVTTATTYGMRHLETVAAIVVDRETGELLLFIDGDIFISSGYGSGCARLRVLADAAGKLQVTAVWRSKRLSNQFTNSVYHQGHLYGSHVSDGPLVCLDYATGKDKWREAHVGRASLLVADGKLICLFEGGKLALVAPNTERYEELSSFQFSTRERCWAAPALANGKLYVRDGERLTCFDLRGG